MCGFGHLPTGTFIDRPRCARPQAVSLYYLREISGEDITAKDFRTWAGTCSRLAITEGIEDRLTVHEATGLGAWAAGSASRMPALAYVLPGYIEGCNLRSVPRVDGPWTTS